MVIKKKGTAEEKDRVTTGTRLVPEPKGKNTGCSPQFRSKTGGSTNEELIHELQVHQEELEVQAEELRRSQLALAESRDEYLDLYEFAPLGYLTLTETALISRANLTAAVLLGVDRRKLDNAPFRRLIVPHDLDAWDQYFMNLLRNESKQATTIILKRGDGETFPARLESIRLSASDHVHSIRVAISDVSDIKAAERELLESEERFRLALRNAPVSVAIQDKDLVFQWAYNHRTLRPEEVKGKKDTDLFVPEEADQLIELKRRTLRTGKEIREKVWLTMDGKRSYLDVYVEPRRDDTGKITGIGVATVDLTEQKLADDALRQNEENLRLARELLEAVTKGAEVIIAAQDRDLRYTFFNEAYAEEIKRLTGKDLLLGASMVELFAGIPEEQEKAVKEWNKVLAGESVNQMIEFTGHGPSGKTYHVLHTPLRDTSGAIVGAGEVAYDVTRQVQVEDKLRETKEYLDKLITCASGPIMVWDPQFRITRFNQAFEHLTGRKARDVIGKPLDILLPESCLESAMDLIRKTTGGERWESVEIPILHKKKEIRTVLWNSTAIYGPDGKTIVSTIAQGQDITGRKKTETEYQLKAREYEKINVTLSTGIQQRKASDIMLKKTLSLLNASLESTADGILVVDQQDRITNFNQNFVNMWDVPLDLLKTGEIERFTCHVLPQLKNPEEYLARTKELVSHPGRESFDMIEFTDGKIFERYSKPQKIGENVVGRVWSFRDITDRKHAEEKLVASVQEKEVLLREIHHRVKNNLQLISGLLDMTRMRSTDESTNSILTDMMLKIQTMAQIHTRLYESRQFGKINLTAQIHDQVVSLSDIYSHKGHEIVCEIDPNEVFLPVDQAIPCALVVNEILSNAYKHAFSGRKEGVIRISAYLDSGRIRITVMDNGIGLPENFDINKTNSLGLKLIRTLIRHQLRGTLLFTSGNGTEITIEFPVLTAGT